MSYFINKLYELTERYKGFELKNQDDLIVMDSLRLISNEVSENIENFQFNKSVAKIYEFVNNLNDALSNNKLSKDGFRWALKKLSIILQPFVPHISEEIYAALGEKSLCINEKWTDENVEKKINSKIAVQINGKTKEVIEINDKFSKKLVLEVVMENDKIKKIIDGRIIEREIYVPGKIVNLVIK